MACELIQKPCCNPPGVYDLLYVTIDVVSPFSGRWLNKYLPYEASSGKWRTSHWLACGFSYSYGFYQHEDIVLSCAGNDITGWQLKYARGSGITFVLDQAVSRNPLGFFLRFTADNVLFYEPGSYTLDGIAIDPLPGTPYSLVAEVRKACSFGTVVNYEQDALNVTRNDLRPIVNPIYMGRRNGKKVYGFAPCANGFVLPCNDSPTCSNVPDPNQTTYPDYTQQFPYNPLGNSLNVSGAAGSFLPLPCFDYRIGIPPLAFSMQFDFSDGNGLVTVGLVWHCTDTTSVLPYALFENRSGWFGVVIGHDDYTSFAVRFDGGGFLEMRTYSGGGVPQPPVVGTLTVVCRPKQVFVLPNGTVITES